jgi:hypothetical protein
MKQKANITYQNYGTSILLFVEGVTADDAYNKWMSLFNWNATSTEPKYVAQKVIACWSTIEKFQRYLFNIAEHRLLTNRPANTQGEMDVAARAAEMAMAEFLATPTESFRSVNSNNEPYEMGEIFAESPDDSFEDTKLGENVMGRVWNG